jgi:hypothetical protein
MPSFMAGVPMTGRLCVLLAATLAIAAGPRMDPNIFGPFAEHMVLTAT